MLAKKEQDKYILMALSKEPVTIVDDTAMESGFETNMKGVISVVDYAHHAFYFVLDAKDFLDHNKSVAKSDYYDQNGYPTKNVFESGLYKNQDCIFPLEDTKTMLISDNDAVNNVIKYNDQNNVKDVIKELFKLNNVSIKTVDEIDFNQNYLTTQYLETEFGIIPPGSVISVKPSKFEDEEDFCEVETISNTLYISESRDNIQPTKSKNLYISQDELKDSVIPITEQVQNLLNKGFQPMIEKASMEISKKLQKQPTPF